MSGLIGHRGLLLGGGSAAAANYDAAVLADSPWAFWKLNDIAGSVAVDTVAARNLTHTGGIAINQKDLIAGGSKSYQLDGTDDRADTGAHAAAVATVFDGNKAWSLEAVIEVSASPQSGAVIHAGNYSVNSSQGVHMSVSATGVLTLSVYIAGFQSFSSAAGLLLASGRYHLLTTRALGGTFKGYINGTEVISGSNAGAVGCAFTSSFGGTKLSLGTVAGAAGGGAPASFFKGFVTRAAMYNSTVSAARALAHAQAAGLA